MLHYESYSHIINIYLNINNIRIYNTSKHEYYVNKIGKSVFKIIRFICIAILKFADYMTIVYFNINILLNPHDLLI